MKNLLSFFMERKPHWQVVASYTLLLASANFVDNQTLTLFHFTYSLGTLLIHLTFCGILIFSELWEARKLTQLIWISAFGNLAAALIAYYTLDFPVPDFWQTQELKDKETWQQLNVLLLLTIGYVSSALSMVNIAETLKILLGSGWLILRLFLVSLVGILVDMVVLSPILLFVTPYRYLALWKMLSLVSVKIILTILSLPICYLIISWYKSREKPIRFE